MNTFHGAGRDISAHESPSTTGKKSANSTDGKTMAVSQRTLLGALDEHFGALRRSLRHSCSVVIASRPTRALSLTALICLALLASTAQSAHAGCGGVRRLQPSKKLVENRAPLIIGDSVLLGVMPEVAREGFEVNAHGCRGWSEGLAYLRARRHAHSLPHLVVLQLGTNWSITVG